MDKKELAEKLGAVMDSVPVCEGLIYTDLSGKVVIGQTLTEMEHDSIGKSIADMLKIDLNAAQKGSTQDISVELENGALVAVKNDKNIVIGLLGSDGLPSKGLLRKQLQIIMSS